MLKSVIFDFDGVIHDTLDVVYPISRQIHGITLEEYKDLFNGNVYKSPMINEENSRLFLAMQLESFRKLQIESHIREELLKINDGYEMFIVSSNSEPILNEYFENNGIIHIFKKVLGIETNKSKVEKFKILMNEYGVNGDNSIFITDTLGDILEANRAGIRSIAVDFGFHERERLEKGSPIKIISDFRHLLPELASL
jgi:phosphoglycolate phosphatase